MALPEGISTVVITTGTPVGFDGVEDIKTQVTVTPTMALVWAATGTPVLDFVISTTAEEGMPASFVVPHVDQPGSPAIPHAIDQELRDISQPLCDLAHMYAELGLDGPELTAGLRKLLEAKDCLVRAGVDARRGA